MAVTAEQWAESLEAHIRDEKIIQGGWHGSDGCACLIGTAHDDIESVEDALTFLYPECGPEWFFTTVVELFDLLPVGEIYPVAQSFVVAIKHLPQIKDWEELWREFRIAILEEWGDPTEVTTEVIRRLRNNETCEGLEFDYEVEEWAADPPSNGEIYYPVMTAIGSNRMFQILIDLVKNS